jgi:hypothetical protein
MGNDGKGAEIPSGSGQGEKNDRWMGRMEAYEIGTSFDDYMTLMGNFMALNKMTDDALKVRVFMMQIGVTASVKVMKAVKPRQFTDYRFDELISICKATFNVQRNTIVEHFRFNQRQQSEGKSLADYALELQSLAEYCKFESFYDTALVCSGYQK